MTFQITRQDIEREAGWSSRYYGITPQHALQVEASYILTDRSRLHLDSQETETWLRQFFPATTKEAQEVKTNFLKLHDSMIQTDEDRKAHDAAYDEYVAGL